MVRSPRYAVSFIPKSLVAAVLLTLAVVVLGLSRPAPAHGASFVVATTTDAYDVTPGNGVCQGVLGFPCSLRAAIQEANALAGPDVITLPAGTYNLTRSGTGEDSASTGDLDITSDITISGAGAGTTIIDAGDLDRVFHVLSGTVSISGVTIRNGNIGNDGGGILNAGTLTLTNSTVSGNTTSVSGGGIYSSNALTLTNSTVSGNTASFVGGGIVNVNANANALTLTDSTVSGNTAGGDGGGIYNYSGIGTLTNSTVISNTAVSGGGIYNSNWGTLTITNSAVSGNTASFVGGGIVNQSGTLTLTNSTITNNTTDWDAPGYGGGIYNDPSGTLTLTNSTVSSNTAREGGGIYNQSGTLTLTNSTVSGNEASRGGGITNLGTLTLTNSTVSGNMAYISGGGFYIIDGTLTLASSTITNNTADGDADGIGDGGGILSAASGVLNLKNTIVAGNFDLSSVTVEPDCIGTLTSQGYNLIQTVSPGCSITGDATGNITGQGADLAPLANNGGPTQTHAILAGSPAIDAGSPDCPPPATDQRGVGRPLGSGCDIGAFESSFGCADDDSDGVCNSADNCPSWPNTSQTLPLWSVPAGDSDCDGFTDAVEVFAGTDPARHCAFTLTTNDETHIPAGWPVDFNDNRVVNTLDLTVYASRMNIDSNNSLYGTRFDLNADNRINSLDLTRYATMMFKVCSPSG